MRLVTRILRGSVSLFLSQRITIRALWFTFGMRQSGDYRAAEPLTREHLMELLRVAVKQLDVAHARREVAPFMRDPRSLEVWSRDFFLSLLERIETH